MQLNDALRALAAQLDLDADALIAYAAEDTIGGFHADEAQRQWTVGSMWGVEGQVLYALTRVLEPERMAEFGVNVGCSSTHFLTALAENGSGTLDSVDPWEGAGQGIPDGLRDRWHMHYERGTEWLDEQPDGAFDLLFEDMVHGAEATEAWWRVALRKVALGGVIISHDATHFLAGAEVQAGIRATGVLPALYSIEPSDCGLAVWQHPDKLLSGTVPLTKEELAGVINGDTLEVKPNGEAKLTRKRAPRKPRAKAKP